MYALAHTQAAKTARARGTATYRHKHEHRIHLRDAHRVQVGHDVAARDAPLRQERLWVTRGVSRWQRRRAAASLPCSRSDDLGTTWSGAPAGTGLPPTGRRNPSSTASTAPGTSSPPRYYPSLRGDKRARALHTQPIAAKTCRAQYASQTHEPSSPPAVDSGRTWSLVRLYLIRHPTQVLQQLFPGDLAPSTFHFCEVGEFEVGAKADRGRVEARHVAAVGGGGGAQNVLRSRNSRGSES